jgi:hypothetical protein
VTARLQSSSPPTRAGSALTAKPPGEDVLPTYRTGQLLERYCLLARLQAGESRVAGSVPQVMRANVSLWKVIVGCEAFKC